MSPLRKHKFSRIKGKPGKCTKCGYGPKHGIHQPKQRRQARHPAVSTPEPLRHVEEEDLQTELHSLIANAGTYLATKDYPGIMQVHHVATLEEAGHETTPQDHGIMLTMNDGSVFRVTVLRERGPEIEFQDQSV